jgi:hypothetical protein
MTSLAPEIDFKTDKAATPDRMNAAMAYLDARIKALETYKPNFDALLEQLQQIGLQRITDGILPIYQRLASIEALGFLNAPIDTDTTANFAFGLIKVTIASDRRSAFTPSPWVAMVREANQNDYALARLVSYDRATGELDLEVTNLWGTSGAYSDVTVWGVAGGALSTLESAQQVATDRAAVHIDRVAVDAAADTVTEAIAVIANGPVASVNGQHGSVTLNAANVGALAAANNLSDVADAATARANLTLGNSAIRNVGTTPGSVAAGDDGRITGASQKAANLADLMDKAAARGNLGLSPIGQQLSTAMDAPTARQAIFAAPFDTMAYQNILINGAIEVNQFNGGDPVANINGYLLDGWYVTNNGAIVVSAQQVADAPPGLAKSLKVSVTTAVDSLAARDWLGVQQNIEGVRWQKLGYGAAGASSLSIGFWFKSTMAGTFGVSLCNSVYNRSFASTFSYSNANTWQWVHLANIPGDTAGAWAAGTSVAAAFRICLVSGSSFLGAVGSWQSANLVSSSSQTNGASSTSNTFQVTGAVILPGSELPDPSNAWKMRRHFDDELHICQRYYNQLSSALLVPTGNVGSFGGAVTPVYFRPMRPTPAMTVSFNYTGGGWVGSATNVALTTPSSCLVWPGQQQTASGAYAFFTLTLDARL